MTLRNLEVFVKVAECGKMSAAARELYISQSSVSQAVSEIEREYGIVLFDRIGKQLFLTQTGSQLVEYAKKAIQYQESLDAWLRQSSSIKSLRVGATVTVGSTILSPILSMLKERCPGIDIHAFVDNTHLVEAKLLSSALDIALVEGNVSDPHIESTIVLDDYLVLICGRDHRFYGQKSVPMGELKNETFLLREHGSGTRDQIVAALEHQNIPFRGAWECHNAESIKQGVRDGHGISILSERLIHSEYQSGDIWACEIEGMPLKRHFSLISSRRRIETDTMNLFRTLVAEYAEQENQRTLSGAKKS